MEYNNWKMVLLDWVNSTGFLVQNYENLFDTNINAFFDAFKTQIKSVSIKSNDVISFFGDYYKDFLLRTTDGQEIPKSEYVYVYSLFLHFSCILYSDNQIQNICKNMVLKNQEIIEKFLECLIRIAKVDRAILQGAMDDAENCDISTYKSPTSRQIQSLLLSTSPQTPKTKMLNSWNLENRNLKAQLETERFERGYLEMQLNQCEKKLSKLDADFKDAMTENNELKKHIQIIDESTNDSQKAIATDQAVKQLQRELNEKEKELLQLTLNCNESKDEIESLTEKLNYAQNQIKSLDDRVLESLDEVEKFKNELEKRDKMIDYVNNNNKELSELLKELQSSTRKIDFDSSASCDMLESTSCDLNSSSFALPEENLASAVVDIRLLDQQKQNIQLTESIERLQDELTALKTKVVEAYKTIAIAEENSIESSSVEVILAEIAARISDLNNKNVKLSKMNEAQQVEIESLIEKKKQFENDLVENEKSINALQKIIDALNEQIISLETGKKTLLDTHEVTLVNFEATKTLLAACEISRDELQSSVDNLKQELDNIKSEKREEAAQHFEELRKAKLEFEGKLSDLQADLELEIREHKALQTKFDHTAEKLDKINAAMEEKATEYGALKDAKTKLEESLECTQVKYKEIKTKFDNSQNELTALRSNKKMLEQEIETQKHLRSELDKKVEELTEEVTRKEKQAGELKAEKVNLESEVNELQNEIVTNEKASSEAQESLKKVQSKLQETLKQSEAKIDELEKVITSHVKNEQKLSDELKKVEDIVTVKQAEMESLKTNIEKLGSSEKLLQDEVQSLITIRADISHQLDEFKQKCSSLEKLVEDKDQQIKSEKADFERKSTEMASQANKLREEMSELTKSFEDTKAKIGHLEADKSALIRDIDELRSTLQNEVSASEKKNEVIETLKKELSLKNDKISELETECASLTREATDSKKQLEELTVKNVEQVEQLEETKQKLSELEADIKDRTEELSNVSHQLDDFKQKCLSLEKVVEDMEQQIESVKTDFEQKSTEMACEANDLREEISELTKDLELAKVNIETLETDKSALIRDINEVRSNLQNECDASEKKNELIESLNKETVSLTGKIAELETECASVNEEASSTRKILEELTAKNVVQLSQLEETKQKLAEIEAQIEARTEELSNVTHDLNESKLKCVSLEKSIEEKENQYQSQKCDFEQKITELTSRAEKLDEQVAEITEDWKAAKSQVEVLEKEKSACIHDTEEIRSKLDEERTTSEKKDATIDVLIKETVELKNKIAEIQSERSLVDEELTKTKEMLEELTTTNVDQTNKLRENERKFTDLEIQHETQIGKLSEDIEKLTISMATQKHELTKTSEQIADLNSQKSTLVEEIAAKVKDLDKIRDELATVNTEKNSLVTKVIQLNRTIDEQKHLFAEESKKFEDERTDLNKQLTVIRTEKQTLEENIEKTKTESANHREEIETLKKEKEGLSEKIENCSHENERMKATLSNLQDENRRLIDSASDKSEVQALKDQINQMQKQYQDQVDNWKKEKESHVQDVKIYRAKLLKERETVEQKDKEHKETRQEYEVKLEKMKEKMKSLYKEEMTKVKEKHEKELNDLNSEHRRSLDKVEAYELKLAKYSSQLNKLNSEKLQLWKDNEVMKTKLRSFNISSTLNGNSPPNIFESVNFKMEDEEGELFDNTYLNDLKGGNRILPSGRESLTADEISRRNSMVPPHLRSSYMPQYVNPRTEAKDDFKSLDDSMFSTQSESRRGTAYKRPGPPTPSKNSGRLSLGAVGDLPRGDILREQNGNERPSIGVTTTTSTKYGAKKSTPGKFRSIFSTSSKLKDEEQENDQNLLQKLLFSTSTPRHRHTRRSSLPRFDSMHSIASLDHTVPKAKPKQSICTAHWGILSQKLLSEAKHTPHKIEWGKSGISSDSTPEFRSAIKNTTTQKSWNRKRRSSTLAKKSFRSYSRKEKRHAIYNQTRRISKNEHVIEADATFSIAGSVKSTETNFGSEYEEIEIRNFQAEINEQKGLLNISNERLDTIDSIEEQHNFEKLCHSKESYCPFDETKVEKLKVENSFIIETDKELIGSSNPIEQIQSQIASSTRLSGMVNRVSNHCARLCWNQQKIPRLLTYKAEKRNESDKNRSSGLSGQSSLLMNMASLHTSISEGWNDLPSFVQYYLVAITLCFIAVVHYQLAK